MTDLKFGRRDGAIMLGISPRTFDRLASSGKIQVLRVAKASGVSDHQTLISLEALGQYLHIDDERLLIQWLNVNRVRKELAPLPLPQERAEIALPYMDADIETIAPPVHTVEMPPKSDFASKYLAGEETDSMGNKIDGSNERWLSKQPSLLGPLERQPEARADSQLHMNQELRRSQDIFAAEDACRRMFNDSPDADYRTLSGNTLAPGYSREQYGADARQFGRRFPRQLSEAQQRELRDKGNISRSFPRPQ